MSTSANRPKKRSSKPIRQITDVNEMLAVVESVFYIPLPPQAIRSRSSTSPYFLQDDLDPFYRRFNQLFHTDRHLLIELMGDLQRARKRKRENGELRLLQSQDEEAMWAKAEFTRMIAEAMEGWFEGTSSGSVSARTRPSTGKSTSKSLSSAEERNGTAASTGSHRTSEQWSEGRFDDAESLLENEWRNGLNGGYYYGDGDLAELEEEVEQMQVVEDDIAGPSTARIRRGDGMQAATGRMDRGINSLYGKGCGLIGSRDVKYESHSNTGAGATQRHVLPGSQHFRRSPNILPDASNAGAIQRARSTSRGM